MYIPPVIKTRIAGPGALLTLPLLVVLAIASVAAWGWWGLFWLGLATGLGAIGALWWESALLTKRAAKADADFGGAEKTTAAAVAERDQLRTERRGLLNRSARLEERLAEIEAEQRSPELSPRKLLHSIEAQIKELDLVQKHRRLAADVGSLHWPAVSVSREENEDVVVVVAHIGGGGERLAAEPVCLLTGQPARVVGRARVSTADPREITVSFRRRDIRSGARALFRSTLTEPDSFSIALLGIEATPFRDLSDEEIGELHQTLTDLSSAISKVVTPRAPTAKEGTA